MLKPGGRVRRERLTGGGSGCGFGRADRLVIYKSQHALGSSADLHWGLLTELHEPRRAEPDLPYLTSILEMFDQHDVTRDLSVQDQQPLLVCVETSA